MQQLQECGIRPSESGDVLPVAGDDTRGGGLRDDVVFFPDRVIAAEILENHGQKLERDPVAIGIVPVAPQPLDGHQMDRSPSVRKVPLRPGLDAAHCQPAWLFK